MKHVTYWLGDCLIREVVTDLVTQIALKWGRHKHDVQLIALLLSHSTAKWDNQLADKQAAMIEARMHSEGRTLGARLKGLLGQSTKQSEAHLPAVSDTSQLQTPVVHSSLWSPPDLSAENKSDSNNKKEHNSWSIFLSLPEMCRLLPTHDQVY